MGDKKEWKPRHVRMDGPDSGEDCSDLFARGITGKKYYQWLTQHMHEGPPLVQNKEKKTKPKKPKAKPAPAAPSGNVVAMRKPEPEHDIGVPPEFSEDGLAERFTAKYMDTLKFCGPLNKWFVWQDERWQEDEAGAAIHRARMVCKGAAIDVQDRTELSNSQRDRIANQISSRRVFSNVEQIARTDPRQTVLPTKFDQRAFIINTPGGVVDLKTGQLRPARREDWCTLVTAVAPDGKADCPNWKSFLKQATNDDRELEIYLQRIAGYCLTASVAEHSFFFCYGDGGNGKGTYINTIQWLLGTYARVSNMDTFTEQRFSKHSTELAFFKGSRLVTAQETDEGCRWNESRIKNLTGGDPITARHMYQSEFTFYPTFKLIFSGNHKPQLRNVDRAIRRRMYLIPFDWPIPEDDMIKGFAEMLWETEGPGIMQWAVDGCIDWLANGLNPPLRVQATTEEYFSDEDKLGTFLADCLDKGSGYRELTARVYKRYQDWCESNGEYAESRKRFVNALKRKGYTSRNIGGQMCIAGVKLPDGYNDQAY